MKSYKTEQIIGQLEKRKGGYFFLKIEAEVINQFPNKRHTRFLCTLDGSLTYQCGLNHLGDGNFFIILSTKNLSAIGKNLGDTVEFELKEDPNPLGVDVPEILEIVLEQDTELKSVWEKLTLGKKRSVIFNVIKIKDLDTQVQKVELLLHESTLTRTKKRL